MSAAPCRCGAPPNADPHPCHGFGYTCRAPATRRLVVLGTPRAGGLVMAQMVADAYETWACDACWERTRAEREGARSVAPPGAPLSPESAAMLRAGIESGREEQAVYLGSFAENNEEERG